MRFVRAREDAALFAAVATPFGAAAILLGELEPHDETAPLLDAVLAAVIAVGTALGTRSARRAPPTRDQGVEIRAAVNALPMPLLVGAVILALAASGDGDSGALLVGAGIGGAFRAVWLRRFEARVGCTVLRVMWSSRWVLLYAPLKDPAPAQRISAHAQSEAARRAP